jgi:hypothetical protein
MKKSSKINLNSLTISSSDSDDGFNQLNRQKRISANPFKIDPKKDNKELLLVNNKEIINNDKITQNKIQSNESLQKKEKTKNQAISSSSSPSSPSLSVKRESDTEIQALNAQFLNKKKFKKSPSIESLTSSVPSSKKPVKPVKNLMSSKSNKSKRENTSETKENKNGGENVDSDERLKILHNYKKEVENYRKREETKKNKQKEIEENAIDDNVDYEEKLNVQSDSNSSDEFNKVQYVSSNSSYNGENDDKDIVYVDSTKVKKIFDYIAIDFDEKMEKQIDATKLVYFVKNKMLKSK